MYQVTAGGNRISFDSRGKYLALLIIMAVVLFVLVFGPSPMRLIQAWLTEEHAQENVSLPSSHDGDEPLSYFWCAMEVLLCHSMPLLQVLNLWPSMPLEAGSSYHHKIEVPVTPSAPSANGKFYGIMFDAGSTGSRIHVFTFQHVAPDLPIELVDEYFEQSKPGLSSFADNPQEGAASIKRLLEKGKSKIPEKYWSHTPLALKATAGLRLLPTSQAEALLKHVEDLFRSYPFKVADDSVSIMDGTDEGIFIWFTANFLQGTLQNLTQTVGVMDLGGGSTQVTFIPREQTTLNSAPKEYMKEMTIFGVKTQLYTHSFLGLGLMSGRLQTLGGEEPAQSDSGQNSNPDKFSSPCFPSSYKGVFSHGGKDYSIEGSPEPQTDRGAACYEAAKRVVLGNKELQKLEELHMKQPLVVSYYYDRAQDAGLVDDVDGTPLQVSEYVKAAQKECSLTEVKDPFLCLDLSYMSALLREGFGFHETHVLRVQKRIRDKELSWALGAMFQLVN